MIDDFMKFIQMLMIEKSYIMKSVTTTIDESEKSSFLYKLFHRFIYYINFKYFSCNEFNY